MNMTTDEMFALLGQKEAELFALRRELANAKAEADRYKAAATAAEGRLASAATAEPA